MRERYCVREAEFEPKVYLRITDNGVELTLRFVVHEHGAREVKDAISREILAALDKAKIGIASGRYEIVGVPPIRVIAEQSAQDPKLPA
jgi:small-conductance mechanosensitive channel